MVIVNSGPSDISVAAPADSDVCRPQPQGLNTRDLVRVTVFPRIYY